MGGFLRDNAMRAQSFELLASIKFARSEAVKRRTRVVMCGTSDPTAATPSCGGTRWTAGWLVFESGDTNNTYQPATDTLLRVGEPAPGLINIRTNSDGNLEFNGDGTTNEGGSTARFALCDDRGAALGRQIDVPMIGRPKLIYGRAVTISCTSPS